MTKEKETHWFQSPNLKYLGHQDLPEGQDVTLTIKSATWTKIELPGRKNKDKTPLLIDVLIITWEEKTWDEVMPIKNKSQPWLLKIKPLICNRTNAQRICKVIGENFIERSSGKKIVLYVDKTHIYVDRKKTYVPCIRVRTDITHLSEKITSTQCVELEKLIEEAGKSKIEICKIMKISSLRDFPLPKLHHSIIKLEMYKKERELQLNTLPLVD